MNGPSQEMASFHVYKMQEVGFSWPGLWGQGLITPLLPDLLFPPGPRLPSPQDRREVWVLFSTTVTREIRGSDSVRQPSQGSGCPESSLLPSRSLKASGGLRSLEFLRQRAGVGGSGGAGRGACGVDIEAQESSPSQHSQGKGSCGCFLPLPWARSSRNRDRGDPFSRSMAVNWDPWVL